MRARAVVRGVEAGPAEWVVVEADRPDDRRMRPPVTGSMGKTRCFPTVQREDDAVVRVVGRRLQSGAIRLLELRHGRAGADALGRSVGRVPGGDLNGLVARADEVGAEVARVLGQHGVVRRLRHDEPSASAPHVREEDVRVAELGAGDRGRCDRRRLVVGTREEEGADCGGGGDQSCGDEGGCESPPAAGFAGDADFACERSSCCGCELAAGLVAVVGVLGEGGGEEVVEGLGQVGALVGELGWGFVEVGEDDGQLGVAVEGAYTGEAFVEDAGERVLVGARVDLAAFDLFGWDVVDRADEAAVAGEAGDGGDVAGEPEVADEGALAVSVSAEEDVAGLDVAVDEPGVVGGVQRSGDLRDEVDRPFRVEAALAAQEARVGLRRRCTASRGRGGRRPRRRRAWGRCSGGAGRRRSVTRAGSAAGTVRRARGSRRGASARRRARLRRRRGTPRPSRRGPPTTRHGTPRRPSPVTAWQPSHRPSMAPNARILKTGR